MSLTELSIKRPLLIVMVFTALILFGLLGYTGLNYNLLPKFSVGVVTVNTTLSGASPSEIQEKVTKPIEDVISTVEGIDYTTSSSLQNVSSIVVTLKSGFDDKQAQQDIERQINQMKSTLPDNTNDPKVNRISPDNFSILNLTVTASKLNGTELYDLIDKSIKPRLSNVPGVGQLNVIGGQEKQISIELNNQKLQAYNLSPQQIYQSIFANSSSIPGGDITSSKAHMAITINGDYQDLSVFKTIVLRQKADGSRIMLTDVATISEGQERVKTINRINGIDGVGIQVFKTTDANAVAVSEQVKRTLLELKTLYASDGFNYEIAADQSIFTLAAADGVMEDLVLAILIVGFVMLLFLHSIRSSMFVLVAIPSAMIPTFIMMYVLGFSLNLMTLMALSLVVGILVDDSIVVLENIFRHLEMGKDKRTAAIDGRAEISYTAVSITLVDVVVFLPLSVASGLIGNILREFALVVVASTLMSLLVAFTITPLLASRFAKQDKLDTNTLWGKIILGFENGLEKLKDFYGNVLSWVLKHKRYLFLLVLAMIIGAIALVPAGFIGASFTGNTDQGEITIQLEGNPDMPIKQTNLLTRQAEQIILQNAEVKHVYTLVGNQTGAFGNAENISELSISLVDKDKRTITTDQFGVKARDLLSKVAGLQVTVIPTSITGSVNPALQIAIQSTNQDSVIKAATQLKEIFKKTAGTDYVHFSTKQNINQIEITPDREKISRLGLQLPDVTQSIQLAFNGNDKIDYIQNENTYSVNIEAKSGDKLDIYAIQNTSLSNKNGQLIQLWQVADIKEENVPQILQRINRQSSITVTAAAMGRPSGDVIKDIKAEMEKTKFPVGTQFKYLGDAKNQGDAFSSLGLALIIAIVLVYMVMVSLYESLIYPFVVLFSIPVALIGAFLILALTMQQLTIFTIIGMIMLLGLVAKNGILIVDFANHLKTQGASLTEALVGAGEERLRPIIMTTLAMILGMLPMALSNSPGAEFKNGLAWVLIGGLTSSFLLTLFIVPAVYMVVEKARIRFSKKKKD